MPSVVSKQDAYYSSHHRRRSSRSQTNLTDLSRTSPSQVQPPNRSLVFLPSTTYSQPHPVVQRSRTPSLGVVSNGDAKNESGRNEGAPIDPHEFYRQYQDPFTSSSRAALHQEAIRTTTFDPEDDPPVSERKSSFASSHSYDGKSPHLDKGSVTSRKLSLNTQHPVNGSWKNDPNKSSPALTNAFRARKASIKDLVARFDASHEEVPPLPTKQIARPIAKNASPLPYASVGTAHSYGSALPQTTRPESRTHETRRTGNASAAGTRDMFSDRKNRDSGRKGSATAAGLTQVASNPEASARAKELLFGEVDQTQSAVPGAGYGISNARRRRGSEGSPMHSPNPMFPSNRGPPTQLRSESPASLHWQLPGAPHTGQPKAPRSHEHTHRRANSDFVGSAPRSLPSGIHNPSANLVSAQRGLVEPLAKPTGQSRIPVSTRHHRMASDSAVPSPTDGQVRGLLRLDETGQPLPKPPTSKDRTTASPSRGRRSPVRIKSPGKRARGPQGATGEKSSSLRANIIAFPPKISPPLRSSRPRQPVSAATTTASRAKMAEKFESMAKQNSERKALRRQRPPELTDIDLKARRNRITQALLSRSKEGQDLKGERSGRSASPTSRSNSINASAEESEHVNQDIGGRDEVPAVVVDEPVKATSEEHAFYTSGHEQMQDQRAFTLNALKIVERNTSEPGEDMDSPTLGRAESSFNNIPFTLNTHLLPAQSGGEPQSALTAQTENTEGTEATIIDTEPAHEEIPPQNRGQSLLNQILALRSQSSNSPLSPTSQASRCHSDHADEVSVRLILRETTYLDDEEAVEKAYRPFVPPVECELTRPTEHRRSSWTSSIEDQGGSEMNGTNAADVHTPSLLGQGEESSSISDHSSIGDESNRDADPDDTYTVVNIALQQQTPSGVVDQQLVDHIYHRIIQTSPDLADAEHVDAEKVKRLCLQELEDYNNHWGQAGLSRRHSEECLHSEASDGLGRDIAARNGDNPDGPFQDSSSNHAAPQPLKPPQSHQGHRYKPSLDSTEDWADTSPSVGDWIQFALHSPAEGQSQAQPSSLTREAPVIDRLNAQQEYQERDHQDETVVSVKTGGPQPKGDVEIPPPPAHSPPPPPVTNMPSIDRISRSSPARVKPAIPPAAPVTRPVTATSQVSARSSVDHHTIPSSSSGTRPSAEEQTPEQRRLIKRTHVLRELVDTEYTYERDMRVLCDIYKQTAVAAISEDDIKIIFGNVEQVQQFSKDFLGLLKQVVKPAYVMEKSDRRKDANRASTLQSSSASTKSTTEITDAEKDELTRVGQAFEASLHDMEKAYTEYIRTRHAANKRLEALQSSTAVREWLKECSENSTDITNAWSLDALLVKPIQRITKYPLLLNQLLEATPAGHPDAGYLRRATVEVTEINVRINEVKKHTELVDQVLNRKRKESDVRNGFTKAFGRRAERLRQHVGINEVHVDLEYTDLKISYDNNVAHLFLVERDIKDYLEEIEEWVIRMCDLAAAAEAWVDVGHTNHPQAESRLRQLAIVIRGIKSIALPHHKEQVTKRVLARMNQTKSLLEEFRADSKGLIQKREKRLLDYSQFKNKKERGERLDKKMTERMEQWEALNLEAKERMRRLLRATADVVKLCQATLVELHLSWYLMCNQKFSSAMEIPLDSIGRGDIVKDWQEDFDYQEASALTLSICNGSLLAEAVNMVSFLTPGSTLAGEHSPRQPSWNSITKRSVSANEEAQTFSLADHRHSGGPLSSPNDDPSDRSSFTFVNGRIRATSAASGRIPKTPESGMRGWPHSITSTNVSRPGTSRGPSEDYPRSTPRLSLEAPSPSLGPLLVESPMAGKHTSTSTFYSAAAGPSQSQPNLPLTGGTSAFSPPLSRGHDSEGWGPSEHERQPEPKVLFTAASVYEFNIDRSRQQDGYRYLTYVTGEIFDVIDERGELWLAINQDDASREIGWIWNKHFTKLT